MVKFRYTCSRHQQMFIEAARRGGCRDSRQLDAVRRKTLAWFSVKFPRMVLDHFNEDSCLGCKLETSGVGLDELERVVLDLAAGLTTHDVEERRRGTLDALTVGSRASPRGLPFTRR
jgi:hypothetical protein